MKLFDAISNIAIKLCRTKIQANSESGRGRRRLQPRREPQTRDKKRKSAAGNQREKGGGRKKKSEKQSKKIKKKIYKKSDEKL
jgi:hypothetical protein